MFGLYYTLHSTLMKYCYNCKHTHTQTQKHITNAVHAPSLRFVNPVVPVI